MLGKPMPAGVVPERAGVGAAVAPEPPPAPREALWYYSREGKRFGPIPWAEMQKRVASRQLGPADLVWASGMTYWSAASTVPGLLSPGPAGARPAPARGAGSLVPPPLPAPLKRPARTGSPWWKVWLAEAGAMGMATVSAPFLLARWPFAALARAVRRRALRRAALGTQSALGQRLYEAKHGDPQVRSQIAAVNERILSLKATLGETRGLKKERHGLLLRLAAPVLAQETAPPGVETEHRKARAAQAALLGHRVQRAPRAPSRAVRWRRVAVGYGVLGCALALCYFLWFDSWSSRTDPASEQQVASPKASKREENPAGKRAQAKKVDQPDQKENVRNGEKKPTPKKRDNKSPKPGKEKKPPRDEFAKIKASVAVVRGNGVRACGFLVRPNLLVTTRILLQSTPADRLGVYFPLSGQAEPKPLSPTKWLYADERYNLAVLEVKTDLPPLALADRHQFRRDEIDYLVANRDLGASTPGEHAIHPLSWLDRRRVATGASTAPVLDQFRVLRRPVNLGGPILDARGKVIGVVTLRDSRFNTIVYGIPLEELQRAVRVAERRQRDGGERGQE
jgi:hypothetical protein